MEGKLKKIVTDYLYTVVNEQRMTTGEYTKADAFLHAYHLIDQLNAHLRGKVAIDTRAVHTITDIGASIVASRPNVPAQPLLSIVALEEYMQRQGVVPNFEVVSGVRK